MTGSDLEGLTAALQVGEQPAKSEPTKPVAPDEPPTSGAAPTPVT